MSKLESLGIRRLESIHWYVHDLERTRRFYCDLMDFQEVGVCSPELERTGKQKSVLFRAGECNVLCSAPVGEGGRASRFLRKHPDGVGTLVFEVEDLDKTFRLLEERGGTLIDEPLTHTDEGGTLKTFSITTPFGDTTFRFVQRDGFRTLMPGLVEHAEPRGGKNKFGLEHFDHVTSNFQTMKPALLWMEHVMGFEPYWEISFHTEEVAKGGTGGSGLRSQVMHDPHSGVKFANNEPWRPFFKTSQINIFNEDHRGDGVQHVAMTVGDIVTAVRAMRSNGIEFMPTPGSYYDALPERLEKLGVKKIEEDHEILRELQILVDGERERSYLLQIFLKDGAGLYHDKAAGPFFYEIIQRKGDRGFGGGNFRALFESIERQQKVERQGLMLDRVAVGEIPRKHHIQLRGPDGALRFEHCITRDGFEGPYTIAYRAGRPHVGRQIDATHGFAAPVAARPGPLRRRHYRTGQGKAGGAPVDARQALLVNADVVLSTLQPDREDPVYVSNSDGDDLVFCFEGGGLLRSSFGDLRFEKNDYVCVPRGTVHRFVPDAGVKQHWLVMECRGGVGIPKQWRNPVGQLRMDAPFSHRDFRRPEFVGPIDEGIREVVVKRGDAFTGFAHDTSPLDVVGWDGTVYPWVFPILNFQARAGLVHLPPTWHGNFAARGALICSFVPRVVDWHPEAIPCPYPHSSVEVDEFLFYCDGHFTSRKGVGPGSASHHPAGIAHGPHPGSYEGSIGAKTTNELAVMLDCYLPLQATEAALAIEDPEYHESFR